MASGENSKEMVIRETKHIIVGVLALDVIMCLVFVLLKRFNMSVVCGALVGSVFAVANFAYLGACVVKAVNMGDKGKGYIQRTYIVRILINCACVLIAAKVPQVNIVAGVIPLFMPRIVIYIMQFLGMYKPEG